MVGLFGCWDRRCGVSGCSTCCLGLVITDMIDGIVVVFGLCFGLTDLLDCCLIVLFCYHGVVIMVY